MKAPLKHFGTLLSRLNSQCSGQPPCNHCSRRGIPCLIDEEGDQRRKYGLKRKVDTLEDKGKLLDRLVTVLQHTDKTCAAQIMNLIRSNASLDEIQMCMDDIMNLPRLEKTPELIDTYSGVQKWSESHKKAMVARPDPKELSDMVLFTVPARPWTSVTADNEFVSHLISLWFTWFHPFLNFIDRDLFIRDMKSGDIESEFCSPFLVNIILASACVSSVLVGTLSGTGLIHVLIRYIRISPKRTPCPQSPCPEGYTSIKKRGSI